MNAQRNRVMLDDASVQCRTCVDVEDEDEDEDDAPVWTDYKKILQLKKTAFLRVSTVYQMGAILNFNLIIFLLNVGHYSIFNYCSLCQKPRCSFHRGQFA